LLAAHNHVLERHKLTHPSRVIVCICTHSRMTEAFRCRLELRTQRTLGCTIMFHIILQTARF
jgi:hypothetical protein